MKYLVFLLPSLISTIILYLFDLKRKKVKRIGFYLGTFILLMVIVNIFSYLIIKYIYNLKTINYTLNFYIKKLILSFGIIGILILGYWAIKKIVIKVDKSDLKLTKPKDFFCFLKRSGIYILSLLKEYPTICFFLSTVLMFLTVDFYLRSIIHLKINFYSNLAFCSNMLTIIYALLIAVIIYLLPKVLGKIFLIFSYLASLILFLASYMLYMIKDNVLSVYDLANAKEGFAYLNFIVAKINISLIIIIIISLIFLIISFSNIKKLPKINGRKKLIILIVCLGLFFGLKSLTLMSLKKYDESKWSKLNYPRYYIGTDIFRKSHKDLFFFTDASWSDKKIYSLSSNANNDEYFADTTAYVNERIDLNKMLISNDYYRNLLD